MPPSVASPPRSRPRLTCSSSLFSMLASFLSLFSFEFYCYLLYGLLLVAVQTCFNLVLGDEPYMDEIFHCRQTQVYCDHNFGAEHWDNKITTLPGLYAGSLAVLHGLSFLSLYLAKLLLAGRQITLSITSLCSPFASFLSSSAAVLLPPSFVSLVSSSFATFLSFVPSFTHSFPLQTEEAPSSSTSAFVQLAQTLLAYDEPSSPSPSPLSSSSSPASTPSPVPVWGVGSASPLCSVTVLRSVNLLFALLYPLVIYHAIKHIHNTRNTPAPASPAFRSTRRGQAAPGANTENEKKKGGEGGRDAVPGGGGGAGADMDRETETENNGLLARKRLVPLLHTLLILLQPTQFFFQFLFYTDTLSTLLCTSTFLLIAKGHRSVGGVVGALAVFSRQTNIIWVFFAALTSVIQDFEQGLLGPLTLSPHEGGRKERKERKERNGDADSSEGSDKPQSRYGRGAVHAHTRTRTHEHEHEQLVLGVDGTRSVKAVLRGMPLSRVVLSFVMACLRNMQLIVLRYWVVVSVGLLFVAFVFFNQGIVVGDRQNHIAMLHLVQVPYFCLFGTLCTGVIGYSPNAIARAIRLFVDVDGGVEGRRSIKIKGWNVLWLAGLCGMLGLVVWKFTFAHPFLLSDNRHLTFYLWKNLFMRHPACKYALIPLYVLGGWLVHSTLSRARPRLWRMVFWFCLSAALVPSPLLEPRYFLLPSTLLLLHLQFFPCGDEDEDEQRTRESSEAVQTGDDSGTSKDRGVACPHPAPLTPGPAPPSKHPSSFPSSLCVPGGWSLCGLVLCICGCVLVDIVLVWVFLMRPFSWPDGSTARFMF